MYDNEDPGNEKLHKLIEELREKKRKETEEKR